MSDSASLLEITDFAENLSREAGELIRREQAMPCVPTTNTRPNW